ncbi:cytochrome C peroxidase [Trichocoleus sp. FACHB-591]|nr:cytochrome C peroxidase [Trichocoleus sp. FACHB-591]
MFNFPLGIWRSCLRLTSKMPRFKGKPFKHLRIAILFALAIFAGQAVSSTLSAQTVSDSLPPLVSLSTVPVPKPPNISEYIKNEKAAIALGKSLFWDMQVGSDGVLACASCHFSAGADNRSKNQINPALIAGDKTYQIGGAPNYQLQVSDFPFHKLANPDDRNSTVLADANDVSSSQGAFNGFLTEVVPRKSADAGTVETDNDSFEIQGINVRRVEPRNSPTVINAVFNFRNFWDGRAQHEFNGQNPFGDRDPNARVLKTSGSSADWVRISIKNSSLASQAVGPPLSGFEMSFQKRGFAQLARKMLSLRPLSKQQVSSTDSALGSSSRYPLPGLKTSTYATLIRNVFQDVWWNNTNTIVEFDANNNPVLKPHPGTPLASNQFTQMEYNFPLFFGLAVQAYEATLVSDQTPFDKYAVGTTSALTAQQKHGLELFEGKAKCINCHSGPEFTNASVANVKNQKIERMRMGDNNVAVYDNGFYNIAVRPTGEDLGVGGTDPFGKPLSFSKLTQQEVAAGAPAPVLEGIPEENIEAAPLDPNERTAVNGAFKTPTLRNVELTGPYFHNGGQLTLRQVVEFYNRGGDFHEANINDLDPDIVNLGLTETEKDDLVAFMKALTDERVRNRKAPFDHPQLFIPNGHPGDTQSVTNDGTGNATDSLLNIPAVGANGGKPLPYFLNVSPMANLTPTTTTSTTSTNSLEGSITQQDCPAGTTLKFISGGYACM